MGREMEKVVVAGIVPSVPSAKGEAGRSEIGNISSEMEKGAAKERVKRLAVPIRQRVKAEYVAMDSNNLDVENTAHEDVGDALSQVVDALHAVSASAIVAVDKDEFPFYPLAHVTGEVAADALIETVSDQSIGVDLINSASNIASRTAYSTSEKRLFVIDTKYNKRSLTRRTEIIIASNSFMQNQIAKPATR